MKLSDTIARSFALFLLVPIVLVLGPACMRSTACETSAECSGTQAEDTYVQGCFDGTLGQIGCRSLLGAVGARIEVPVSLAAISTIDAFTVDVAFPSNLVQYDSSTVGNLTADFDFFGANMNPSGTVVRVGGFEVGADGVPTNASGDLAVLHFTVMSPGCGTFCISNLQDDLSGLTPCEASPAPVMTVGFDAGPGTCPNRISASFGGASYTSVILGSATLQVTDIAQASIRIEGAVVPFGMTILDVGGPPPPGTACGCALSVPDGFDDLLVKVSKQQLFDALGATSEGGIRTIHVTGTRGGTPFEGTDCAEIRLRKLGRLAIAADLDGPVQRVSFDTSRAGPVRVAVFDVSGRLVESLSDTYRAAGSHRMEWDASRHSSGVYFVRVNAGEERSVHKIVVVR